MARFYPDKYLDKVMPGGLAKNGLLYDNLSIKQRYLKALYKTAGREGKALKETVLQTIAYYAKREEGAGSQALLTRRIENFLIWNKVQEEKEAHGGQFYRWLPSDAENPDPEHQLLYGKVFRVGTGDKDGNMPGERYGCRCGIEWLEDKEMTANEKIKAVKLDFRTDSVLPPLNEKDLKIIDAGNKPVVLKKTTARRNRIAHSELHRKEYKTIIGQSLYKPVMPPLQDIKQKNYWHFIGEMPDSKKSFVLLDVEEKKKNFEIVHVLKMKGKNFRQFLRKYLKRQKRT